MRIKELRIQNNISQKDLAEIIGVAPNTLSQYETGKREPDNSTLIKLAQYFGVTVDYLLKNETPSEVPPNFPARLKYLREQKGLSYEQMADDIGYTPAEIEAWESGRKKAEFKTLTELVAYFDTTVDYLTGNDAPEEEQMEVLGHHLGRILTGKKNKPLTPELQELLNIISVMEDDQITALLVVARTLTNR